MNFYRFEHVNQVCQNLEATRQFYQTLFPEWRVRAEGEADGWRWMHFGDDHFYLALNQSLNSAAQPSTGHIDHVGFVIQDGEKMKTLLEANHIDYYTYDAPETKYRLYVTDPDGTSIELVEYDAAYELR